MVTNLTSAEEKRDLYKAFDILNTNRDGKLTRDELKIGFETLYSDYPEIAKA